MIAPIVHIITLLKNKGGEKSKQRSQQPQNGTTGELSLMHFLFEMCRASDLQKTMTS